MARTLFFVWSLGSSQKLLTTNSIFISCNIFYNHEYFFFQSAFWSLFNHRQRSQSNQEWCSLCCSWPCFLVLLCTHDGSLQCISTCFLKLKRTGALRPRPFPDYVISCDYDFTVAFLLMRKTWNDQFSGNVGEGGWGILRNGGGGGGEGS